MPLNASMMSNHSERSTVIDPSPVRLALIHKFIAETIHILYKPPDLALDRLYRVVEVLMDLQHNLVVSQFIKYENSCYWWRRIYRKVAS